MYSQLLQILDRILCNESYLVTYVCMKSIVTYVLMMKAFFTVVQLTSTTFKWIFIPFYSAVVLLQNGSWEPWVEHVMKDEWFSICNIVEA